MRINQRNVLSDDEWNKELQKPFQFDLQRFGHRHGKSGGKIFSSIIGGVLGFYFGGALFGVAKWGGAILGSSLFGSVWSATHQPSMDTSSADVSRFDRAQETMSSDLQIPVVYGLRKVTGNQTYHSTDADATTLHKHVALCEGGILGVWGVTANDLIIPKEGQDNNTVFTITNVKYNDAHVKKRGQDFELWAGEHYHKIHLCTKKEIENSHDTFWEYQVSVSSLISYINQLYSEGWQAFPYAGTNTYPGDLWDAEGDTYSVSPAFGTMEERSGYVNFKANTVKGGTMYTFHDCTPPDNYEEVGGYPSLAWLDMTFHVTSELNGNPSVSAIVAGKKVYDTRTGQTVWSTNPAMCLRDFMLSERYGLGKWIKPENIDEDSFKECADYCDEVINMTTSDGASVQVKRFELNMVIDQKNDAIEWLKEILANFQAYLTIARGKFKLHIEKETAVSYAFNDDNCSDLSVVPMTLAETPNKYVVKLIDPKNNWNSVACVSEDFADQKQRQKIITKEVNLNGCTSQYQALRLARFYRDQNLVCPLTVQFSTSIQAMHLEPGDVVTLTYHEVFKELPIRITEITQDEEGKFKISGRQYNGTIYGDDLSGGIVWNPPRGGGGDSKNRVPPQITGVVAYTNVDNEILIEHDASTYPFFSEYRYYVEDVTE